MTTGDPRLDAISASASTPLLDTQRSGTKLNGLLVRVLARQHIRAVYQPIVQLDDGTVVGYEALARPTSVADDGNVAEFFTTAEQLGVGRDLDWLCRRAAVTSSIRHVTGDTKLFLNLNASTLVDAELDASLMQQMASTAGMNPGSIVLEITAHALSAGAVRLPVVAAIYHHYGLQVALADFDHAHDDYASLAQCRIDYIKFARSVSGNLDATTCGLITDTVAYAADAMVTVVAEGIERQEQTDRLAELGVRVGQGYFYGKPAPFEGQPETETADTVGV